MTRGMVDRRVRVLPGEPAEQLEDADDCGHHGGKPDDQTALTPVPGAGDGERCCRWRDGWRLRADNDSEWPQNVAKSASGHCTIGEFKATVKSLTLQIHRSAS
jgi:hypothetical protein